MPVKVTDCPVSGVAEDGVIAALGTLGVLRAVAVEVPPVGQRVAVGVGRGARVEGHRVVLARARGVDGEHRRRARVDAHDRAGHRRVGGVAGIGDGERHRVRPGGRERVRDLAAGGAGAVAEVPRALHGRVARGLRRERDRLARDGPLGRGREVGGRVGQREPRRGRDGDADAHQGRHGPAPRSVPAHP
jgi:hypothetical protein